MKFENYMDDAIKNLERSVKELQKAKDLLPKIISKDVVLGTDPRDYPRQFSHSDWECKRSPTKYCMYTNEEWDSCIFCYEPEERK